MSEEMNYDYKNLNISILKDKIVKEINIVENCPKLEKDYMLFKISDEESYIMHHEQHCCESVSIEDICGEIDWLLNSPILIAEERSNNEENSNDIESQTWTFYELATLKGAVTIRWYGTSNGYYSETVDFNRIK